ncbi:MAG: 4-hydroxy-3-methylbut-2-enyl diphosphate reductase [Candidatus Cloacimonadota bacterium]|nr:MAG: 4-hydroxy-3-methylbut-2-enyl diphosphate reductase [Candidatus Cloacimonadota bacterium]
MKLIISSPRGFCAGVTRAIEIVEKAILMWGSPIYVKHEIVHNKFVVEQLKKKGAIFVEELEEIPSGSRVIFSAHGVPPKTFTDAKKRNLQVTDATCPLVTKVHKESKKFSENGCKILLVGHQNHVEVIGTKGVSPDNTIIIENVEDVKKLTLLEDTKVAMLTQTTLSLNDTKDISEALYKKFPNLKKSNKSDICYATTNRQQAISEICKEAEIVLVVGSKNSSNSNRLKEVAQKLGVKSHLIENKSDILSEWFEGIKVIGLTAGASTPEILIKECIEQLKVYGVSEVEEKTIVEENISFSLPVPLKEA